MSWKTALLISTALLVGVSSSSLPPAHAQELSEWSAVETLSRGEEVAASPVLTCDDSGAVHAFWESEPRDLAGAVVAIAYSRRQNGEWSTPVDVVLSPDGLDARYPRAVVDTIGRLHLFWLAPRQGPFGFLYHSWAPAGDAANARQWQPAQLIAEGIYQCDVRLDSQGRLHVLHDSMGEFPGICHVVSGDHGDTWSRSSCIARDYPLRDQEYEVRPRLAIDSEDTLHAVWMVDDYSPESKLAYNGRAVYYARSESGGLEWSSSLVVDEIDGRKEDYDRRVDGVQPEWGNIVVDRSNGVHIVWVGRPDMQRYHQWSDDGGRTWSERQVAIPSGGYNAWQGLAVDDDNRLHLFWPSLKGMEYAWWDGEAWAPAELLSDVGNTHNAQAVVALGNQLHVVWQDHGGRLDGDAMGRVFYATLQTGAHGRTPSVVPTVALPGQMTPTPMPSHTPDATVAPTPLPEPTSNSISPPGAQSSPVNPVAVGIIPAALIVGIVLLWQIRKR